MVEPQVPWWQSWYLRAVVISAKTPETWGGGGRGKLPASFA